MGEARTHTRRAEKPRDPAMLGQGGRGVEGFLAEHFRPDAKPLGSLGVRQPKPHANNNSPAVLLPSLLGMLGMLGIRTANDSIAKKNPSLPPSPPPFLRVDT